MPLLVGSVPFLWAAPHFGSPPSTEAAASTVAIIFVGLVLLEQALRLAFWLLRCASRSPVLEPVAHRINLSRRGLEIFCMSTLTILGLEAHERLGGFVAFSPLEDPAAIQRATAYDPLCARLALFQLSYQTFNTFVSLRDNDGRIFIGHHIATGLLCVFALRGQFLQHYAAFFLGLTEISSVLLCGLAVFDPGAMGVPGMPELFPVTMQVLGVAFAVAFILVRIVLWPWMSYVFWTDVFAVLRASAHPGYVCYWFLVTNAGLSALQLMWLGEIVTQAAEIFAPKLKAKRN